MGKDKGKSGMIQGKGKGKGGGKGKGKLKQGLARIGGLEQRIQLIRATIKCRLIRRVDTEAMPIDDQDPSHLIPDPSHFIPDPSYPFNSRSTCHTRRIQQRHKMDICE